MKVVFFFGKHIGTTSDLYPVAGLGFYLRGGFCQRGRRGGVRKSLEELKVEVKVIFLRV